MADDPDDRVLTARLDLRRPAPADVPRLHEIFSDPRVWTHYPSRRHTLRAQTAAMVEHCLAGWDRDGLSGWTVRRRDDPEVIGYGGVDVRDSALWNLGYRLAPEAQGQGYATELALEALRLAAETRPELPVTAFLLQHNRASAAVARKVGLTLVQRGPDAGNPDPAAVREVYADRPLTARQLAATLR